MAGLGTGRIAIIGNSGGGKSTLARKLAAARGLPLVEADRMLWRPGWQLAPVAEYERDHAAAIARPAWIIEGLGRKESARDRLRRATEIILIDMPLEVHLRLATERHAAWEAGTLAYPPAMMANAPPLADLLATVRDNDRTWMPDIRRWVVDAETAGTMVTRVGSVAELETIGSGLVAGPDPAGSAQPPY